MTAERKALSLLSDAVSQVVANPAVAHFWHGLGNRLRAVKDPSARRAALEQLVATTPRTGEPGFLRATLLYSFTQDLSDLADAGAILRDMRPVSAERGLAFLTFAWGLVLSRSDGRANFQEALHRAGMVAVVFLLSQHIKSAIAERLVRRPISKMGKVGLLAPHLSSIDHASTALALHHARLLAQCGYEVEVFSAQELSLPDMKYFLGNGEVSKIAPPNLKTWQSVLRRGQRVHLADTDFSLMMRWASILRRMTEFDPDLVFMVGFFSPLAPVLFEARPVLGLSLHTVPPLAPVDVWLCADASKEGTRDSGWGAGLPPCEAFHYPYRISLKPLGAPPDRASLGLRPDGPVLLSVGDRLAQEISPAWASRMGAFLEEHPDATWLLVGGNGQPMPVLAGRVSAKQVRYLAHHDDVRGICRCCDVFVNPPRMGGGFSVAMAMAEALPVLAYAGSDGGDKIGAGAAADDAAFFARLAALLSDRSLRHSEGAALQKVFSRSLDLDQAAPRLQQACERALQVFNKRLDSR